MKQYKRGASWPISQKERKSEKIRLSPINRYFAMVPRKYLAKLSQTRISSSCRSCFLLKKCSSPPQTFNTQKRSKRRGREAVERANDRSSDAESFFLKSRGPFSSTSFSRFSSPSSLSRDVQSSINNLAPIPYQ